MPSSPSSGFLRTLLFLSRWDWREEPLIVDSAETITSEERTTMRRELESWRKRDPHMNNFIMFVATSSNLSGQGYTRNGPSKLIASRMTRLAKAACNVVRNQDLHLDPAVLFESSLQDYDVLIHLSKKVVKTILREAAASCESSAKRHSSQYKNLDDRTGKVPLPTRTHPTTVLLQELQRVYNDSLIFFVGRPDDSVVAAIWNPKLQPKQKFRVGLPYNFCKIAAGKDGADEDGDGDGDDATTSDVVEVNREAILLEIARAGGDMIRRIEVSDD